jgi:hypothetical protein
MKALTVLACCLFLVAIGLELIGKASYSTAAQSIAKAAGRDPASQARAKEKADTALRMGQRDTGGGAIVAALGITCWLLSLVKGSRRILLPGTFFAAYVFIYFIMV